MVSHGNSTGAHHAPGLGSMDAVATVMETLSLAQGFFYNRYTPEGNATGQSTGANTNQQLWYHLVGTPQSADTYVLALPDQPDWSLGAGATDDEKCVAILRHMPAIPCANVLLLSGLWRVLRSPSNHGMH